MKTNNIFSFVLLLIIYHSSFGQNQDTVIDLDKLIGSWQYRSNTDSNSKMFYSKNEKNKKIYFGQTINIIENGSFVEQRTVPCGNDTGWRYKEGFWKIQNTNILQLVYSIDATFIEYKILKLELNELLISKIEP